MEAINSFFQDKEWDIVHSFDTDERQGQYRDYNSLGLSEASNAVLSSFENGIYEHQWLAINEFNSGENVCVSTSTSSGKTLIFNISGIELLSRNPEAKILAIYPLKALGTEQESRWREVLKKSRLPYTVGRIDGAVAQSEREKIIKNSSIVIMTPDVIHAWLLSKLSNSSVTSFLKRIALIVIDEAHTYSGVFGSNSAYLYRRLQHLIVMSGGSSQIVAASATIKNPADHLQKLTGVKFSIIGDEHETSPKKKTTVILVNAPKSNDLLTSLSNLMRNIVNATQYQFITFVDSRKQTEYIASISSRKFEKENEPEQHSIDTDSIKDLPICPYRSGYEEADRNRIQGKLSKGDLRGVISTSALEMGIDIPHLNLGILVGIPNSATSFYQRIGRIGRHQDGIIIIVNNGSIQTESIFREPHRLLEMPLSESALYLDNPRIQYIHALCLARQGGEDEVLKSTIGLESEDFIPKADFPSNFVELCNSERIGEISSEFQAMKAQAGEDPNHIYPLRDIDVQYKVECRQGPHLRNLGSLGYSQVMREAYPGAVYYYQTQTFRIFRLNTYKHLIEVRPEKKYTTKPTLLPTLIFPNLSEGNVIQCRQYGDLTIVECNLQIRESIAGFIETRGRNELDVSYPLDKSLGLYFDIPRFTRNYFTTGVIINYPLLNRGVKCPLLSEILYEAFFMVIPFERQDISYGSDKHRADREEFRKGSKFISIFDQTYGSLRLTSRFLEHDVIEKAFMFAIDIAENDPRFSSFQEEINALRSMKAELNNPVKDVLLAKQNQVQGDENHKMVILPGSVGLDTRGGRNEEFFIESIFYSPTYGLSYKGRHLSKTSKRMTTETWKAGVPIFIVPVESLQEIPGESKMGLYDLETGDIYEG
ncbi:MAG: DEAD/DEAH box helicase [Bradymonadia bacterium]|jgi:DEAD/DEAH box helicase domain-containing protein